MATLTHKSEAFVGTVSTASVSAHRTGLAGVVGVHLHRHAPSKSRFVGDVAVQLSKGPGRGVPIALALLGGDRLLSFPILFALVGPPLGALADVCQVFQADQAVWVRVHNASADEVIAFLFQPSLSSGDAHQTAGGRTSAFLLQSLSQSGIVVSFGSDLFASIERGVILWGRSDRQVALAYIYPNHLLVGFWGGIWHLDLQADKQIELFLWLVIPEFGGTQRGAMPYQGHVGVFACIGDDYASLQREDAQLLMRFETVVILVVIGQGGREVLRRGIQALVALLGVPSLASGSILLDFGPQSFVGGSDLAGNVTGHLGRQAKLGPDLIVAVSLQGACAPHLPMLKGVLAHIVQAMAVRQLGLAQGLKLLGRGMQFELGGEPLFHASSIAEVHMRCQDGR